MTKHLEGCKCKQTATQEQHQRKQFCNNHFSNRPYCNQAHSARDSKTANNIIKGVMLRILSLLSRVKSIAQVFEAEQASSKGED